MGHFAARRQASFGVLPLPLRGVVLIVFHRRNVPAVLARRRVESYHVVALLLCVGVEALPHSVEVEVAVVLLIFPAVKLERLLLRRALVAWQAAWPASDLYGLVQGVGRLVEAHVVWVDCSCVG